MEGQPFGRFRLLEPLRRGSSSETWRAYDHTLKDVVALRLLHIRDAADHAYAQRFRREAKKAAKLHHPNIAAAIGSGTVDGQPFLSRRWIVGGDLRLLLADGQLLPAEQAVSIVEQIASALDAAHGIGLVHGHVTPANVVVDDDGVARLTDFGATCGSDDDDAAVSPTGFASESSAGHADARTDVYGLTGVLYFCLTGRKPFRDGPDAQLAKPPRPSERRADVPRILDVVIATGLAKDPELRYPSAGALAAAARRALDRSAPVTDEPVAAVEETPARSASPQLRRRLVAGSALLVTAAVAAFGVVLYTGRDRVAAQSATMDGTYNVEFQSPLAFDGSSTDDNAAPIGVTMALRSTCPANGCVAVAKAVGANSDPAAREIFSGNDHFEFDSIDGAWTSVTATGSPGAEKWRVLSLRRGDDGTLSGTFWYVGGSQGSQRHVTMTRTGGIDPRAEPTDPATLPPRQPSPAMGLRGTYTWTRAASNVIAGDFGDPVQTLTGLRTFTNCLRGGERCFSMLTNTDGAGMLLDYADGAWSFRRDRQLACQGGGYTRAVWSFDLPVPPTTPDPVPLLTGSGHMENTGDCALSADTDIRLERAGD